MKPLPKLLSKTKILRGYRCAKAIYLTIHRPELEPVIGPEQQAVFDQGNQVGEVARTYFPGGVLVDNKPWDFGGSLRRTRELFKEGAECIYEASFEYKGCYARADILKYSAESKRWTLLEVKSSTKIKPEHLEDVGLQAWIIANSGLPLEKIGILHLNPECRYPDLSRLFVEVDVTDLLRENYRDVAPRLNSIFSALRAEQVPDVDLGPHCVLNRDCEFKKVCWEEHQIPALSVFNVPRLGPKVWDFYKKGQIALEEMDSTELNELQKRMLEAHIAQKAFIDQKSIRSALSSWRFPLIYLDFETINPPIPRFQGCAPYQHVPFQFSVHKQDQAEGPVTHVDFLFDRPDDPRPDLITALLEACAGEGSIVSYYAQFEKKCIEDLAEFDRRRAPELLSLLPRFVDPLDLVRDHVYELAFAGRFSLKTVAPALLGNVFSYEGMPVSDGGAAQRAYRELTDPHTTEERHAELRLAMLDYCTKDTMAMVEIVNWLSRQT